MGDFDTKGGLGIFNQERYHNITLNDKAKTRISNMSPATTDGLANVAEAVLSFFHVPSESDVFFKAFITTFAESYSSDWNAETVFGRTDPIYTFKNTQRRITLVWKIPAETIGEAYENLAKVQRLAQFLYPNYANMGGSGAVLSQSPIVRLKIMNLLAASDNLAPGKSGTYQGQPPSRIFEQYKSTNDPSKGQLGVITSMNVNHNLENPESGVIQKTTNTILPKTIEVTIDFACIHEKTLGWNDENKFIGGDFPYNAPMEDPDLGLGPDATYNEKMDARRREENKRQVAAQDAANAKARGYDGMFGGARLKKDIKYMQKLNKKRGKGKTLNERQQANYDYLESALHGQMPGVSSDSIDSMVGYQDTIVVDVDDVT